MNNGSFYECIEWIVYPPKEWWHQRIVGYGWLDTSWDSMSKFASKCINLHLTASFPYSNPGSLPQSPNMMMEQRYTRCICNGVLGPKTPAIAEIISSSCFFMSLCCTKQMANCDYCRRLMKEDIHINILSHSSYDIWQSTINNEGAENCDNSGDTSSNTMGSPSPPQSLRFWKACLHKSSILQIDTVSYQNSTRRLDGVGMLGLHATTIFVSVAWC